MPDDAPAPSPPATSGGLDPAALFAHVLNPPPAGERGWTPPTVEELQHVLPQYEMVALLGRGGMGAVYKAWQKSLDRQVAIKVLPAEIEHDEAGFADRFKREAKAMARLNHPGIVAVHDAGETGDGLLYYVMDFVDGTDVQQLLTERGKLPVGEAVSIATRICDALAYAHRHGVIHRDIKPSNIMLDSENRVKVADFGLAKIVAEDAHTTAADLAMGTPDFIAPEVLAGAAPVDHRADLFAVGVMLYRMLTGKLPRGRFDPPSRLVEELDPRFDTIIDRALQAEPAARYASASELHDALVAALSPPAPFEEVRRVNPGPQLRRRRSAFALAIFVVATVGTYFLQRRLSPPPTEAAAPIKTPAMNAVSSKKLYPRGQWIPVQLKPENTPGMQVNDGWIALTPPEATLRIPGASGSDWAIRARFRSMGAKRPKFVLRHNQGYGYNAWLARKSLFLRRNDPAAPGGNVEIKSLSGVVPRAGAEFVFTFAAVGQTLFGRVNDQSLTAQIDPPQVPPLAGQVRVFELDDSEFRDLAVMNLEGVTEAEALKLLGLP
jgi:serine/threonine protein kinase